MRVAKKEGVQRMAEGGGGGWVGRGSEVSVHVQYKEFNAVWGWTETHTYLAGEIKILKMV